MKEFRMLDICNYFTTADEKKQQAILAKYQNANNVKGWSLPLFEKRGKIDVSNEPQNDIKYIGNEILNNGVLSQLQANVLTNLQNTITLPELSNTSVKWNMKAAVEGANNFRCAKLSPFRLTCFTRISQQLIQQNEDIESFISQQVAQAINEELEKTMFSSKAATEDNPKGLANGIVATPITNYDSVINLEGSVKDGTGYVYVVSPSAKKALRKMTKGSGYVLENGMIDGTKVIVSSNVEDGKIFYLNEKNLAVTFFYDGIEIIVDNYTEAKDGIIKLVIHLHANYTMMGDSQIAVGQI